MPKKEIITEIEGRRLKLSNLQKVLYPAAGIVKAEIINYYITAAPYILKYISGRPLTLIRFPDGIMANRFHSKNKPNWTPQWAASVKVYKDDDITYIMANETATLA
ncbi:MAG: bifunctional non-homologous end joining protein LigD [Saprospiraceae bacterium]